jgi:hypothetical protein
MRVQCGNRVAINFKDKLKNTVELSSLTKDEQNKVLEKILSQIEKDYKRITDGIVALENNEVTKLPSRKNFQPHGIITDYNELVLVDQYMNLLKVEEKAFKQLESVLKQYPIYTEFLSNVSGVGPAIAGVIMSEIDIYRAKYVSNIWRYAGLDVVSIGTYVDNKGVEHHLNTEVYQELQMQQDDPTEPIYYKGYLVQEKQVSASRKEECLVTVEYTDSENNIKTRKGIRYNPFLKTKLMGILGSSFLKSGRTFVNDVQTSSLKRKELAIELGYKASDCDNSDSTQASIDNFLRSKGYDVRNVYSKYGQSYYDYRNRLNNHPKHKDKTPKHKHNMALRYAVKRFLVDLYLTWRTIEGLPVTEEYSVAKLGKVHGEAGLFN